LTGGGPGRATEVISLSLHKQGFQVLDAAYASTIATIVLIINLVLTVVYLRLLRRRDDGGTRRRRRGKGVHGIGELLVAYGLYMALALVVLYPLAWVLLGSFKNPS